MSNAYQSTADNSKWRIHLCALDGTFPPGSGPVLNAGDKDFVYQLNSGRQMTWSMTLDNPRCQYVLNNDCLAKVYRKNRLGNWVLLLVGDVISMEETSQGDIGKLTCIAADPFWRLNQRWLGWATDDNNQGIPYLEPATGTTDLTYLIVAALASANNGGSGEYTGTEFYTGIYFGPTIQLTGQQNICGPLYAAQVSTTIQALCATAGGPDFELVPAEPAGAWPLTTIANMNVWSHLGTLDPSCIFEYGMGRNTLASYDRIVTKSNLANIVLALPPGFPTLSAADDHTAYAIDYTSLNARGMLMYIDNSGITPLSLRQALVNGDLSIMSNPQQQLSAAPVADCPLDYTADYNVGDLVICRAFDKASDTIRFNGSVRLYGVELTSDVNDLETCTLTLTPDGASGTTFPNVPGDI
jgi:hypothetical protein